MFGLAADAVEKKQRRTTYETVRREQQGANMSKEHVPMQSPHSSLLASSIPRSLQFESFKRCHHGRLAYNIYHQCREELEQRCRSGYFMIFVALGFISRLR